MKAQEDSGQTGLIFIENDKDNFSKKKENHSNNKKGYYNWLRFITQTINV